MNNFKHWAYCYTRKYNESAERARYEKIAKEARKQNIVFKLGCLIMMMYFNFRYRLYKWCRLYTRASVYTEIIECLNKLKRMK